MPQITIKLLTLKNFSQPNAANLSVKGNEIDFLVAYSHTASFLAPKLKSDVDEISNSSNLELRIKKFHLW